MIIDIANTLEFDERDYHNLAVDEKKIIERIIKKQKNMANINTENLIDHDITKIKKRLQILIAEINAGNNSSILIKEALQLLKDLFKNGSIGHSKYHIIAKNIKSHID